MSDIVPQPSLDDTYWMALRIARWAGLKPADHLVAQLIDGEPMWCLSAVLAKASVAFKVVHEPDWGADEALNILDSIEAAGGRNA
jgi:hypothetical protein